MSSALLTVSAQRVDGTVRKLELDPHRRISRTEAGERCNPPVKRVAIQVYHKLAISYVPGYSAKFYVYRQGKKVINFRLLIPETHLPVLQRIREEFDNQKSKAAVVQWMLANQEELQGLLQ